MRALFDPALSLCALAVFAAGCDEVVVVASDPDAAVDSGDVTGDGGAGDAGAGGDDAGPVGCGATAGLPAMQLGELGPSTPMWERPSAVLGCPTQTTGISVPYDTYVFCAQEAGAYEIAVRVEAPMHTLDDPVLFVYEGAIIPADPTLCIGLASRDESAIGSRDAVLDRLPLDAGDVVTVVVTADTRTGSFGTYELRTRRLP